MFSKLVAEMCWVDLSIRILIVSHVRRVVLCVKRERTKYNKCIPYHSRLKERLTTLGMLDVIQHKKMKLRTYCKYCQSAETINGDGILFRNDLELRYGETVPFTCSNCKRENHNRINKVFAVDSKMPMLLSSIVGIAFLTYGILTKNNSQESIIYTTAIGAMFFIAGFYSNARTSERAFNKTFV